MTIGVIALKFLSPAKGFVSRAEKNKSITITLRKKKRIYFLILVFYDTRRVGQATNYKTQPVHAPPPVDAMTSHIWICCAHRQWHDDDDTVDDELNAENTISIRDQSIEIFCIFGYFILQSKQMPTDLIIDHRPSSMRRWNFAMPRRSDEIHDPYPPTS